MDEPKRRMVPGQIRDSIIGYLQDGRTASVQDIYSAVSHDLGNVSPSSVRSYLRLNVGEWFQRSEPGLYRLKEGDGLVPEAVQPPTPIPPAFKIGQSTMYQADCMEWLRGRAENSIHAIVTDPPYGLVEYTSEEQVKLRAGKGGVWRIPPSFDGHQRSPLPRFTVLDEQDLQALEDFFFKWAKASLRVLVPGGHCLIASNALLAFRIANAVARAGYEPRGQVIRLVMTMRGGDRPKNAHDEFPHVSVMPRSMSEPWLLFRKPIEGRVQDNLRKWKTGGLRRPSQDRPFGDVIASAPTRAVERALAPHPSLKPQAFMRQVVRAILPLGEGVVLDSFAGSGSTLAAAEAVGYESIGIEKDKQYVSVAKAAIPKLKSLAVDAAKAYLAALSQLPGTADA